MQLTRRDFLKNSGAMSTLFSVPLIVPGRVLGKDGQTPPSETLCLGCVGIGGIGKDQIPQCEKAGFHITALTDVDFGYAKKLADKYPQARRYNDFREMLSKEGGRIDAVYCGTPDHTHAIVTLAALKARKHICCVKPLTRTLEESRVVENAAKEAGVVTQMTACPNNRKPGARVLDLVSSGIIGEIRTVHSWSFRPVWPQGMRAYPAFTSETPKTLDWEMWLGPSEKIPFADKWPDGIPYPEMSANWMGRAVFHPFNFRGWAAFGGGALGDMGCHRANTFYKALRLGVPESVTATSTTMSKVAFPLASIVTYDFPAREGLPPCRVVWFDGGIRPPAPKELGPRPLPKEGTLYFGSKGTILEDCDKYMETMPVVLQPELQAKAESIPYTTPVSAGGIYGDWHNAIKGGGKTACGFDWAVPLTKFVILGNLALLSGKPVRYDAVTNTVKDNPEAQALIAPTYHNGWKLE